MTANPEASSVLKKKGEGWDSKQPGVAGRGVPTPDTDESISLRSGTRILA